MNMSFLQELFSNITQREALLRRRTGNGLTVDHSHLLEACRALLESDGEASSITHASHALEIYSRLDDNSKTRFFERLGKDFSADPREIDLAYAAYRKDRENTALQRLFDACEPRRQELLRRLNLTAGGTYELVRMREDLLRLMRDHKDFAAINADFTHLFASWFNRGFLVVKRIDWNTPAAILERIIRYEAVHKIRDWGDLRRRLDNRDRRCYAFFHPAIGDEPLIFVEVALTRGLPDQIQPILDTESYDIEDPEAADTAAFFGISNCQVGLRGISFGNFLIKQVVQELKQELPNLKNFVTLSPMPGFRKWLESTYLDEQVALDPEALATLKQLENPDWLQDPELSERLNAVIRPLAARYLLKEKNRDGQPLNPVARFHLGNGAELHRINWQGDISAQGLQQSTGLMINYLYVLDNIERNHEQYITDHTIVCSSSVRDLSRRGRKLFKGETGK
ncbi:malonyl-CoA decarboxylase [Marinobacter nanhaiticus D15-8W]|uniref:MCD, Malonyl-CoA decarboxylase MCD n=1 Tax=Marinobacter nanhaiticus D15-8W TaxID=626887 RepID=N6VRP4_9GAMM|nr:malonyl-CoA decarboxylase [Marinobacter nanhaiticus]ENO12860.1 MCD, Malonyl-CoA decarboxylase MCD [Marinobacter nanhaiticus D15-8W]BES70210.1 malonyl-CoA decarboxylase [Marinobacter nanhaiticus D15-8W]